MNESRLGYIEPNGSSIEPFHEILQMELWDHSTTLFNFVSVFRFFFVFDENERKKNGKKFW